MRTPRLLPVARRAVLLSALALLAAACADSGGEPNIERSGAGDRGEPAVVTGFDGSTIHVGILVPSSGPSAEAPADRAVGVKAYLDYINTELGGIGGRYAVQVDVVDSSDPTTLQAGYIDLRDRTVLLAQVQGIDVVESLATSFADDQVLAGVAPPDIAWVQSPNLVQTGVPDQVLGASALAWLLDEVDNSAEASSEVRPCSALQLRSGNDAWQAGVDRAAALLAVDVPPVTSIPAVPDPSAGLQAQVDQLREAGCNVVLLGAGSAGTAALLEAAAQSDFAPRWVAPATAVGGVLADADLENYIAEHLIVVGDGPTADPPVGRRELLRIHDGYAPGAIVTPAFTAGYLQGKAIVAVLDAAVSSGDLSREGVLAAAARLRSVRFDELSPDAVFGSPARRRAELRVGVARPNAEEPTRLEWLDLGFTAEVAEQVAAG